MPSSNERNNNYDKDKTRTYKVKNVEYTLIETTTTWTGVAPGANIPDVVSYNWRRVDNTPVNDTGPVVGGSETVRHSADQNKVLYFTNFARMYLNVRSDDEYIPMSVAYLIIYVALVTFTIIFVFRYLKRLIYLAFLTLMAPVVAITYPIDKLKDRKSTSMGFVV